MKLSLCLLSTARQEKNNFSFLLRPELPSGLTADGSFAVFTSCRKKTNLTIPADMIYYYSEPLALSRFPKERL
jgi:hypothetical protein